MKNESDFWAYAKALFEAPITILFVVLDIVSIAAFFVWVVDDWEEGIVVLCFILILHIGQYIVYKKQRNTIKELSQKLVSFNDSLPKLRLQFLDSGTTTSHLIITVPPLPPEPNYDELLVLEMDTLDELYRKGKNDSNAVSKLAFSAMLIAGRGVKDYAAYKDECIEYLKEYREYLERDFYFRVKENRLRSIKFQVDNFEGKTLARDIVVKVKFPKGFYPIQDDQYAEWVLFDNKPIPPQKPSVMPDFLLGMKTRLPFMDIPIIPSSTESSPRSVRGPYVDDEEVKFEVDKLLHNFSEDFDDVYVLVKDEYVQKVWDIEYSIHSAELPKPVTGTVFLEIRMKQS